MTLHPAYPDEDSLHTLLALVTSAFEATSQAWSLRLTTASGVQSAWLPKEAIPFQVAPGQVWNFTGEIVDLGQYGAQFEIRDGVPSLPTDLLLIRFLAHHVPGLVQTRAQRMWERLGNAFVESLASGDVSTLAHAHGGPTATQIVTMAIEVWTEQVAYTRLARELYQYGFTERTLRTVVSHYGNRSLAYVQDDPYRLLAFAELGLVDQLASQRYGIRADDHRRLMGIVDAAVYALFDSGTTIFLQEQLETIIQKLSSLSKQEAVNAISLALQHGRLVAATNRHLMGEGFARIEHVAIQYFANYQRPLLGPQATALGTQTRGTCEISRAASKAVSEHVSIIIAHEEPVAFNFVRCLADLFDSEDEQCYIVAGSDALCQRIHAATGIQAIALSRATDEGLDGPRSFSLRRVIAIVSSTIDLREMARLLMHLRPTDRLIFVGQQLRHAGDRALMLPSLLAVDQIFRCKLPSTMVDNFTIDGAIRCPSLSNSTRRVYNPRESERQGVFWICVTDDSIDRAVVGVSHQLRQYGSVAIVTRNADERQHYARLIDEVLVEPGSTVGGEAMSVVTADSIEPGDSDSSVIVLRQPKTRSIDWLHAAIGTTRNRAVIVSTAELDCQLSTAQDDRTIAVGFASRWHQVTADQE